MSDGIFVLPKYSIINFVFNLRSFQKHTRYKSNNKYLQKWMLNTFFRWFICYSGTPLFSYKYGNKVYAWWVALKNDIREAYQSVVCCGPGDLGGWNNLCELQYDRFTLHSQSEITYIIRMATQSYCMKQWTLVVIAFTFCIKV